MQYVVENKISPEVYYCILFMPDLLGLLFYRFPPTTTPVSADDLQ